MLSYNKTRTISHKDLSQMNWMIERNLKKAVFLAKTAVDHMYNACAVNLVLKVGAVLFLTKLIA
jgi:hypothetical protein